MACGSEQALSIALSYIARGGIVGEVAGDELIVPNGLGDVDHGAACLCRKAKTPKGLVNRIA